MQKSPMCTHLSHIGIFVYQLSEGKADAGSVNRIVQVITQAIAGIRKRPRFFNRKICAMIKVFSCCLKPMIFLKKNNLYYKKETSNEASLLTNYRTKITHSNNGFLTYLRQENNFGLTMTKSQITHCVHGTFWRVFLATHLLKCDGKGLGTANIFHS